MKLPFITFEGLDGAGKDSQLYFLVKKIREDETFCLGDKYSNVWITREPTNITNYGKEISRKIREGYVSKEEATKLYIQDRLEHTKIIKNILEHSIVLCSRYDLSTLSYQLTQGMDFEELYALHNYGTEGGAIIPDVTLVFDLPVDVALNRIRKRGDSREFFEEKLFQSRLDENLRFVIEELRKKDNREILLINANQSKEDVSYEVFEKLSIFFNSFSN